MRSAWRNLPDPFHAYDPHYFAGGAYLRCCGGAEGSGHRADAANAGGACAFRANSVEARMSAAFEQAKVPDCLHSDALKLQPAHIGPVNVVGPYSLPWVIAAVVRGKCN